MAVLTVPNPESTTVRSTAAEQPMNVLVRWNEGKTLCLQVHPHISIAHVKELIWQKAQQQPTARVSRDFCMVCRGKVLDADDNDDRTLMDVVGPVSKEQVLLQVWTRQRGGCFMVSCSILGIIIMSILGSFCTCGLSLFIVPVLLPLLFILPLCCL